MAQLFAWLAAAPYPAVKMKLARWALSVQQVVDKIAELKEATGVYHYVEQIDIGGQRSGGVVKEVELPATKGL
jgi:hypothetical protein